MKEMHPMAGKPVKITQGKLAGRYFIVIDWLTNQFQGKAIEKLHKSQGHLTRPVVGRGYPLDDDFVFGRIYPEMRFICVHDKELQLAEPAELNTPPLPQNVVSLAAKRQEKEDDSRRSSESDNSDVKPGESEHDGRSLSGPTVVGEHKVIAEGEGYPDSQVGSTVGGEKSGEADSDKRKAPKRARTPSKARGEGEK